MNRKDIESLIVEQFYIDLRKRDLDEVLNRIEDIIDWQVIHIEGSKVILIVRSSWEDRRIPKTTLDWEWIYEEDL